MMGELQLTTLGVDVKPAMKQRHSTRMFVDEPLGDDELATIRSLAANIGGAADIGMHVVSGDAASLGDTLDSVSHYGKFRGVRHLVVVTAPPTRAGQRNVGYYGELLVLLLTNAGFDTGWVGGSLGENEDDSSGNGEFRVAIAVGHAARPGHPHRSKAAAELCELHGMPFEDMPAWFQHGIEAVQLAPSALNRQPVRFELLDDADGRTGLPVVRATATDDLLATVGLGVAELHFELGAGRDSFVWA
ncbi:nitroreductase family protein [Bifidobacterium choloepi]|uniref:Putative nitroreductase TM1586 domain-containing protein n=1 Tax=Bifidobacterium choloepi TaxID=2614131 RepID=A0A6I5NA34_9BIFI|nr:nitroreductase family protein [Bifidobacterium choloepi]NEG69350.1 hypothetical protein [Bifidobacterium choloepi]